MKDIIDNKKEDNIKEKEEEIEIKNLCPMIAMISAGKTSLLKVLYDIDYLESSSGITTKIVSIIRYNSSITKPKLYHLNLKKKGNDDYSFFKDNKEPIIIGEKDIKNRVIELNKELKEKERPYEELFYILEVGTTFIKDKEYLKEYDLVDIPGLSEYKKQEKTPTPEETPKNISLSIPEKNGDLGAPDVSFLFQKKNNDNIINNDKDKTIEEEMKGYNPESEKNYLTEIFKIIKNKMNNGIFVFNIENYLLIDNYRIIGKLQKVINKPIENFLLILNKIDKSDDINYDINNLGCKIMEYFPNADIFNFTKNIIVPCSTIQLENELKMHKSFIHLIYYHFINYTMNNKNIYNTEMTPNLNNITFIDYLKKLFNNLHKNINKKEFYSNIKEIINDRNTFKDIKKAIEIISKHENDNFSNIVIRIDDFEEDEINKIEEIINKNEEEEEEENEDGKKDDYLDINDQENNMIILYFYYEFLKNKNILPLESQDTRDIINYFSLNNIEKNKATKIEVLNEIKKKKEEENTYNNKIDKISNNLKDFYISYEEETKSNGNFKNLSNYIDSLIELLKNTKTLYIPLLGLNNAGKSTILNSLIGFSLLPSKRNECTKKGILIRHWNQDYIIIRKTKFVKEKLFTNNAIYYFSSEEKIIAQNEQDIQKILEGTNGKFTKNEEDFFYEINVKIKFIDELKIDDKMKQKICFIDLPGFGTNNSFEVTETYSHLIQSCNIFLFVVFNLKIAENDNHNMLENLRNIAKKKGIPTQAFINKCLFIINFDKSQVVNDSSESECKRDILKVFDFNNKNINEGINVCFLNAKSFEDYNFKLRYYNSLEFLFDYEYNIYLLSKEYFWKGKLDKLKGKTFLKHLLERLKENIKNDITEKFNEKEVNIDKNISINIKEILNNKFKYEEEKIYQKKNPKAIEKLEKYLTFAKNNIRNCDLLNKSNINSFTFNLMNFINKTNEKKEDDINENLLIILKQLDFVFQVSFDTKFGKFRDIPIFKKFNSSLNELNENLKQFKEEVQKIFLSMEENYKKYNIQMILTNSLDVILKELEKQKINIEENLKKESWDKIQENFEFSFKTETTKLKKELLQCIQYLSQNIKENYDKFYELMNKFLINQIKSPDIILSSFISNKLGRENNIEQTIDDIINDILLQTKTCTYWSKSKDAITWFRTKIYKEDYLYKIIDTMIDNTNKQIKKLLELYFGYIKDFKMIIENDINLKKDIVINNLEEKIRIEENKIKNKNEEEKKKWEEEKIEYEKKKTIWEKFCQDYRKLRDELFYLRLGKNIK